MPTATSRTTWTASKYVYKSLLQGHIRRPGAPCRRFADKAPARPAPRPSRPSAPIKAAAEVAQVSAKEVPRAATLEERLNTPDIIERWVKSNGLRSSIVAFIFTLPIAGFFLYHFPITVMPVTGNSMAPTFNAECTGENSVYTKAWIIVQRWDPRGFDKMAARAQFQNQKIGSKYNRGDIVVYTPPHKPESEAVKRVVGIAGDRVTPIDGGEPVVVPFNHLWVEGDAGDKAKSMDSNWFGPLSARMVIGKVLAVMPERSNPRTWMQASTVSKTWPAKEQRRVEEEAVEDVTANPTHTERYSVFQGEQGVQYLETLKTQAGQLKLNFVSSETYRKKAREGWILSRVAARGHPDPDTKRNAKAIAKQYEELFTVEALRDADPDRKAPKRFRGQAPLTLDPTQDDIEAEITATFGAEKE